MIRRPRRRDGAETERERGDDAQQHLARALLGAGRCDAPILDREERLALVRVRRRLGEEHGYEDLRSRAVVARRVRTG